MRIFCLLPEDCGPQISRQLVIRLPADRANPETAARGVKGCAVQYGILDKALEGKTYIADDFSMGDVVVGATLYRYFCMDIERPSLPNLEAYYKRLCDRAAFQKHVMIPFGSNHEEWEREEAANARVQ